MKSILSLPCFALMSLVAACSSSSTPATTGKAVVFDTLGLRFDVDCSTGICAVTPQNPAVTARSCSSGTGIDSFVLVMDPLLAIYAVHVPSSGAVDLNAAEPSHPVACATDTDCLAPGITFGTVTNSYTCRAGLCQLQQSCVNGSCMPWDGVLLTYDVLTLCQADIPWPTACPYITSEPFAGRIAEVGAACGSNTTCATVPADCRQITAAGIDGGI